MTKKDKKQLLIILSQLEEIRETIDSLKGLEEEKYDNMSDGWQESERGCTMAENIDSLDAAFSGLDDAVEAINDILER